jgi:hypothetical protein
MKPTDPRQTWWFWRHVQERLTTFALALVSPLKGKRYRIVLESHGTGYHDPKHCVIQANPAMFRDEPPGVQFRVTQGLLAHEAAHALFTGAWPDVGADGHPPLLCQMTNILEDERIERCVRVFYPGIVPAIQLLGDLCLAEMTGGETDPKWQAVSCCLAWRWAQSRMSEAKMLKQLRVQVLGKALWAKVKPLVEEAWGAPDTTTVIELARRVLDILGLPHATKPLAGLAPYISLRGIPVERSSVPLTPDGPCETTQPGLGENKGDDVATVNEDDFLRPEPYTALEDSARPLAKQLAEALRVPEPDVHPQPHEWRGRYHFRQDTRTPETPCLFVQGLDRTPRSVALYVLVDRSGSMGELESHVQLALMTLYLAATELAIPTGIIAFGANHDDDETTLTFPIVGAMSSVAQESAKALIAGYRGTTANEFLDWGLRIAERELVARPERLKVLVVIHDGQPVYSGKRGWDWDLSQKRLRHLENIGITPIGVYLGQSSDDQTRLRRLFRWLVVCTGEQLPERLGDLLRSLA